MRWHVFILSANATGHVLRCSKSRPGALPQRGASPPRHPPGFVRDSECSWSLARDGDLVHLEARVGAEVEEPRVGEGARREGPPRPSAFVFLRNLVLGRGEANACPWPQLPSAPLQKLVVR